MAEVTEVAEVTGVAEVSGVAEVTGVAEVDIPGRLTAEQRAIVRMQTTNSGWTKNLIVSTNAGCGKTYTIKMMVRALNRLLNPPLNPVLNGAVIVCAELGQATLVAGHSAMPWGEVPAETIAYLICKAGIEKVWKPLRVLARMHRLSAIKIIVDEWSMVVYENFVALCTLAFWTARKTPTKVSVVLFGDEKQLPAVGHGLITTINSLRPSASRRPWLNDASAFVASNFSLAGFMADRPQAATLTKCMRFGADDEDIAALAHAVETRNPRKAIGLMRCLEVTYGYPRPHPTPGIRDVTFIMYKNKDAHAINTQAWINRAHRGDIVYFLFDPTTAETTVVVQGATIIGTVNVRTKAEAGKPSSFLWANGQRGTLQDVVGTAYDGIEEAAHPDYKTFRRRCLLVDKHLEAGVKTHGGAQIYLGVHKKRVPFALAAGSSIHKMQGETVAPPTIVVVDLLGVNDIRLLYVAVTRVKFFWQLRFKNLHPDVIERIMMQPLDTFTASFTKKFRKALISNRVV